MRKISRRLGPDPAQRDHGLDAEVLRPVQIDQGADEEPGSSGYGAASGRAARCSIRPIYG